MNYLGHMLLAHERSEAFQFGAMAPDFAGMHRTKIIKDSSQVHAEQQYADFYEGVAFHEQTDIVFDQNRELSDAREDFCRSISPKLHEQGFRQSLLLAKVGIDLLVDGVVQQRWPEVGAQYQKIMKNLGGVALETVFSQAASFHEIRDERIKRGPPNYADPAVVASILHWRVSHRNRLRFDSAQLPLVAEAMQKYSNIISRVGQSAILETARNLGVDVSSRQLFKK